MVHAWDRGWDNSFSCKCIMCNKNTRFRAETPEIRAPPPPPPSSGSGPSGWGYLDPLPVLRRYCYSIVSIPTVYWCVVAACGGYSSPKLRVCRRFERELCDRKRGPAVQEFVSRFLDSLDPIEST